MLLVTGITGKSGSWFCRRLAQQPGPQPVRVVVRPGSGTEVLDETGLSAELLRGDLSDAAFVQAAMQGVHTVLHITSILFSENIVKAAIAAGTRRVILVHTTGVYSRHKRAAAEYVAIEQRIHALLQGCENPPALTILRPTMIYGSLHDHNISSFIHMVDRLRLFPLVGGGKAPLQPVHAKDLGNAYFDVLHQPEATAGKEYVLSGQQAVSLKELLRSIRRFLDKKATFVPVPYPLAYAGAVLLYGLSLGKKDLREKVQRLVEPRAFAHDAATADFGYAPMPLEEGLRAEVEQYLLVKHTGAPAPRA